MATEYSLETIERLLVNTRAEMKQLNSLRFPSPAQKRRISTLKRIRRELYAQHRAFQMELPFDTPIDASLF